MSYEVLARKWRPQTFADVVGQPHVLQPLLFQLKSGHLHSAILFTGTRGVGKTTLARLFAKALNCDTNGISDNPCNVCSACTDIQAGRYPDLIEVDAASRTRVEDTLELLENANYLPSRGRFKIYLIDEVHMLSNSSFNALLKTLEEPPPHVKFILATTDPQKLPITVLSRCLQFSLRAIPHDLIASRMREILSVEQIEADPMAIDRVAHAARGSLRDALTLLDQAIAFGQGALTLETVTEMLGTVSHTLLAELLDALIAQDSAKLFEHLALAESRSLNYDAVLVDMLEVVQSTALMQFDRAPLSPVLIRLGRPTVEALRGVAAEDLQIWYQIILQARRDQPYAATPYQGFEMAWIRLLAFEPTIVPRRIPLDWQAVTESSANQVKSSEQAIVSDAASATDTTTNGEKKTQNNVVADEHEDQNQNLNAEFADELTSSQANESVTQDPAHDKDTSEPTLGSSTSKSTLPAADEIAAEQSGDNDRSVHDDIVDADSNHKNHPTENRPASEAKYQHPADNPSTHIDARDSASIESTTTDKQNTSQTDDRRDSFSVNNLETQADDYNSNASISFEAFAAQQPPIDNTEDQPSSPNDQMGSSALAGENPNHRHIQDVEHPTVDTSIHNDSVDDNAATDMAHQTSRASDKHSAREPVNVESDAKASTGIIDSKSRQSNFTADTTTQQLSDSTKPAADEHVDNGGTATASEPYASEPSQQAKASKQSAATQRSSTPSLFDLDEQEFEFPAALAAKSTKISGHESTKASRHSSKASDQADQAFDDISNADHLTQANDFTSARVDDSTSANESAQPHSNDSSHSRSDAKVTETSNKTTTEKRQSWDAVDDNDGANDTATSSNQHSSDNSTTRDGAANASITADVSTQRQTTKPANSDADQESVNQSKRSRAANQSDAETHDSATGNASRIQDHASRNPSPTIQSSGNPRQVNKQVDAELSDGQFLPLTEENWPAICNGLPVPGYAKSLATNCAFAEYDDRHKALKLWLNDEMDMLHTQMAENAIIKALGILYGRDLTLEIEIATPQALEKHDRQTPEALQAKNVADSYAQALESMRDDANVKQIQAAFGVSLEPQQIRLLEPDN